MTRKLIYAGLGALLLAAVFLLGYLVGTAKDIDAQPLSKAQSKKVAELREEFPGLPVLRGNLQGSVEEGTAEFADPTRAQFDDWMAQTVWRVYDSTYDEAFEEGKKAADGPTPEQLQELVGLIATAQRLHAQEVSATASSAQVAASLAQAVQVRWKERFGQELKLDPAWLLGLPLPAQVKSRDAKAERRPRSLQSLELEVALRKEVSRLESSSSTPGKEGLVLVN